MDADAVVIGAGHNGLAAAVHLAARGWKVAVVEQAAMAGGAVKTAEATLPGFRHDLYAMNLSMFSGSPFLAEHRALLEAHGLAFVPAERCFASVFRDGTALGVGTDLERTAADIAALSVTDAAAWRAMLSDFGADAPHIFALLGAPMPSLEAARVVWKALRAKGSAWVYDTLRLLLASPRDFLDARFENDKVKTMMAAWGLHLDFAPDVAGGALFPYLESMANQAFGMVIGKGGADVMVKAMVGALTAKGGEVILSDGVARVELAFGKATGVILQSGRRISAKRAVISNAHPKIVFGSLVKAETGRSQTPRRRFEERIGRFRAGPGTMMIHLALDGLPDWTAGEALKRYAYVHVAPDMAMMARVYAEAMAGLLPAEPVLVVGQPTTIDPSRAPAGRHVLWVQVRVLPAAIKGDAAGTIEGRTWESAKDAYAERAIDLLDAYAPGIRAKILGRAVHSPDDLERDNPNLIGGDNLSGSHHLDQNFLFRPVPGWSRYRTPVENLFLCGAPTWPGAGTGAGSGYMVAKMLTA